MTTYPMNDLYGAGYDFPRRAGAPSTTLMLATVARTGSTHFGTALWRTGALGAPLEYVNFANRLRDMVPRVGGGDMLAYWRELQALRTSPSGVFSFKAFGDFIDLANMLPRLGPHIRWDRIVFLTRRDTLGQAISYARAVQTRTWFAGQTARREPAYDRAAIDRARAWIATSEAGWEAYFRRHGCDPLRVSYEDVHADLTGTVARVAAFAGVELDLYAPVAVPALRVQRDAVTHAWRIRYQEESGGSPA